MEQIPCLLALKLRVHHNLWTRLGPGTSIRIMYVWNVYGFSFSFLHQYRWLCKVAHYMRSKVALEPIELMVDSEVENKCSLGPTKSGSRTQKYSVQNY